MKYNLVLPDILVSYDIQIRERGRPIDELHDTRSEWLEEAARSLGIHQH